MEIERLSRFLNPKKLFQALAKDEGTAASHQLRHNLASVWRQRDLALLYDALEGGYRCYLQGASGHHFQTVILGIDLERQQLMLDECVPPLPALVTDDTLTLTIREPRSYASLLLNVSLQHTQVRSSNIVYLADILDAQCKDDRRQDPRIRFVKHAAPLIKLTIPMMSQIGGRVSNLSTHGACAEITGIIPLFNEIAPLERLPSLDCQMEFANNMRVRCKARLKSYLYNRKPSTRATLRMVFHNIREHDRSLLFTLVDLGKL